VWTCELQRRVGQTPRAHPQIVRVCRWVAGVVGLVNGEERESYARSMCSASQGGGPGQWERIKHGRRRARAWPCE